MSTTPTTPTLLPVPRIYQGMAPPTSFDVSIFGTGGFYPSLIVSASLQMIKPDGSQVNWGASILEVQNAVQPPRLILRRYVASASDFDQVGYWSAYALMVPGTNPGGAIRSRTWTFAVNDPFQEPRS